MNDDVVHVGPIPSEVRALLADERVTITPYAEMSVSDDTSERIVNALRALALGTQRQTGGSAFNVMRVLAAFAPQFRLGLAGVAGGIDGAHPHIDFLRAHNIEDRHATAVGLPAARSVVFSADGDRTIFTSQGANRMITAWLTDQREVLSSYIAGFDVVHVTSFLDEDAPELLSSILLDAISSNPHLLVSVDPGHVWTTYPPRRIHGLLRTTGLLHLSAMEFSNLGGRLGTEPEIPIVRRIMNLMHEGPRSLVLRRHDSATVYLEEQGFPVGMRVPTEAMVPAQEVVDATGAGDVFTAGVLAIAASPQLKLALGVRLGAALAKRKLRAKGPVDAGAVLDVLDRTLGPLGLVGQTHEKPLHSRAGGDE